MIITESSPESPLKLAQDQLPSEPSSRQPQSPPPYSTNINGTTPNTQHVYQQYPDRYLPSPTLPLNGISYRGEDAKKRFFKALCTAIAIYVIFVLVLRSFILLMVTLTDDGLGTGIGFPRRSDGNVDRCVCGDDGNWTHVSGLEYSVSFDLPLSADNLYLLARGSQLKGSLEMVPGDPSVPMGTMRVDIYAQFGSRDVFRRTTVCALERTHGEKGIGIFAPNRLFSRPSVFQISVRLPHTDFPPLPISAFEANLPSFRIAFPALDRIVHFGSLSLHSTNSVISLLSVRSEKAEIVTTNSPISGLFKTSTSLSLKTSNSPIKANVSLENDPNSGQTSVLNMQTSNGKLDTAVRLMAAANSSSYNPLRYSVTATTSNSLLGISFPQQQPYSHLDLTATSSNGATWVRLNPAYEGTFDISTSPNLDVHVHYDNRTVVDPTGQRRARNIWRNPGKNHAVGWVEWERGGHVKGSVVVQTTNAPNDLILQ